MGSSLVTAPTTEPVRLADLQQHLRVDDTNSDALLANYLRVARQYVENCTRRALITQTWDATFDDGWPMVDGVHRIDLPMQPVQSVTSVTYVDDSGATQTLATNQYVLRDTGPDNLAYIAPAYGVSWPGVRTQPQAVTVRYVAGYGTATAVPDSLRVAIMLHVELLFDRNVTARELLEHARDSLLMPYRVVRM